MFGKFLIIISVSSYAFACSGCVDSVSAEMGKQQINMQYDMQDNILENGLNKQKNLIEDILNIEEETKIKLDNLLNYEIDGSVLNSNFIHELQKTINIRKNSTRVKIK